MKIEVSTILRLSLSVLLYLALFYSIFDIYYSSPLRPSPFYTRPNVPPLAKTIVFIVADGLRTDKLFTETMNNTPILRDILMNKGSWGLSHTHVPTESRPGHVAIFAGFYEDVASITKGWQANAVEFDSVFNRSRIAWAWGGPDVVPLFHPPERRKDPRVFTTSYSHEMLDFTAENITRIDDWVISEFRDFMLKNSDLLLNESEDEDFRRGNFVFLHLSAADQLGHTSKPNSPVYTHMIHNIDVNVGRLLNIFNDIPSGDQILRETAFIFTSDHGMTDWGSHGAGSLHETVTPLILWGAGIPPPKKFETLPVSVGDSTLLKYTYGRHYHNVNQADLCPLVAALLGIPIPANSVGELSLHLLDIGLPLQTELIRTNALQIIAQFQIRYEEQKQSHYQIFFTEFSQLTQVDLTDLLSKATLQSINRDYASSIATYKKIIRLGLAGLNYYHKYDRFLMGFCIMISYAIWSILLCSEPMIHSRKMTRITYTMPKSKCWFTLIALIAAALILTLKSCEHRSTLRTFYQLLPLLLCLVLLVVPSYRNILPHLSDLISEFFSHLKKKERKFTILKNVATFLLLCVLLEFALWGFIYRVLLSLGVLLLAVWPLVDTTFITVANKRSAHLSWFSACFLLAIFPLFPVVGSFASPLLVLASSCCVCALAIFFHRYLEMSNPTGRSSAFPFLILVIGAFSTGILVFIVRNLVSNSIAIPFLVHIFSWILLVSAPCLAMFFTKNIVYAKMLNLSLAFFIPFNLMNLLYEGWFFLVLSVVSYMWTWFESGFEFNEFFHSPLNNHKSVSCKSSPVLTSLNFSHLRRPVFYVFLLLVSFFGTGNIASLNTFDPISIYCFMTVLNPATMGALMIFKILCPMVVVGIAYAVSHRVREVQCNSELSQSTLNLSHESVVRRTSLLVTANFLAVHFFAMLKDEGSWLDIGESISHYVIAMSTGLASLLLSLLGVWMLSVDRASFESLKKHA